MYAKYLTINGVEFTDGIVVNNAYYNLLPSSVIPASKVIKNVERAIDGTAHVDITAVMREITVRFDHMQNAEFEFLSEFIGAESLTPEPCVVECFDFIGKKKNRAAECYVESFEYIPYIVDDELTWRDVTVKFCEIGKGAEVVK